MVKFINYENWVIKCVINPKYKKTYLKDILIYIYIYINKIQKYDFF